MKIKEQIIRKTVVPITFGLLYSGLILAVNAGQIALEAGIEALFGKPQKQYTATLVDKGYFAGLNTKADFAYGRFATENGDTLTLIDGQSVLTGKIFPNGIVPKLEVGKAYRVTQKDDISSKIIGAEEI